MKRFVFCVLSFCLFAFSAVLKAQDDPVQVIGFTKEGRMELDGSGHYPDLVRAIVAEAGVPAQFHVVPVIRSIREFGPHGPKCLVPAALRPWMNQFPNLTPENTVEGEPIDYITAHIVTKPGTRPITNLMELEGKRLGHWIGVQAERYLPEVPMTRVTAQSEESTIRMLMSGRVDVILSWNPDVYILFSKLGFGEPSLEPDNPIYGSTAHFLCHRTPETEAFIEETDKVIRRMRSDGRLKEILGVHSQVVGADVPMTVWRQASEP